MFCVVEPGPAVLVSSRLLCCSDARELVPPATGVPDSVISVSRLRSHGESLQGLHTRTLLAADRRLFFWHVLVVLIWARFGSRTIVGHFVLNDVPPAWTYNTHRHIHPSFCVKWCPIRLHTQHTLDTSPRACLFRVCWFRASLCMRICRGEAEGRPGGDAGRSARDPRPGNGGWRNLSARTTWCFFRWRQQREQRNRCTETSALPSFGRSPLLLVKHCFQSTGAPRNSSHVVSF